MASEDRIDLRAQANGFGIAAGLVCGLVGYAVNQIPGAIAAALAGYGAARLLVFLLHTLKAFLISGIILLVGAAILAGYVGRLGNAIGIPTGTVSGSKGETRPFHSTDAATEGGRVVWFMNSCRYPVNLFLRWKEPAQGWVTEGYWQVPANKGILLDYSDGVMIRADSPDIFFHAYAPGLALEWSGANVVSYGNTTLPLMRANVVTTTMYNFSIGC